MSLAIADPTVAAALVRLAPYARGSLERAADRALQMHADAVALEHLLCEILDDESSAAHSALIHGFADPGVLRDEVLALAPGILVVGSARSLPFSERAVRALFAARDRAEAEGAPEVGLALLAREAMRELRAVHGAILDGAGVECGPDAAPAVGRPRADRPHADRPTAGPPTTPAGSLFRLFSADAKRVLSRACRLADRMDRAAIGPAHVLLACLEQDAAACGATTAGLVRLRAALSGRDADESVVPARALEPEPGLSALLRELPAGADTLSILRTCLDKGTAELRQLLVRQRVTPALLERARPACGDP